MWTNKMGVVQPLILTSLLAIGFAVVWGVLGLWVTTAVHADHVSAKNREWLVFRADGTPIVNAGRWQTRDLAGNPLPAAQLGDNLLPVELPARSRLLGWPGDVSWPDRLRTFGDDRRPPIQWHFVTDGKVGGSAYLVGYDSVTKTRVGFLGTVGFREGELQPEEHFPFSGVSDALRRRVHNPLFNRGGVHYARLLWPATPGGIPQWYVYVQTDDHKIYQVDLSTTTVRVVFESPSLRSSALAWQRRPSPDATLQGLVVRTDSEVLVLDARGEDLRRFALPEELREQDFDWAETTTGEAVLYTTTSPDEFAQEAVYRVYWIDPAGRTRLREEVTLRARDPVLDLRMLLGVLLPAPVLVDGFVGVLRPLGMLTGERSDTYSQVFVRSLAQFRPALALVHLLGAAMAWLCYRHQKRQAAGTLESIVWPIFVFLFGLPGWLGYRYGRSWPVLERCPACSSPVPQDREQCGVCQVELPLAAPQGTEVYAA